MPVSARLLPLVALLLLCLPATAATLPDAEAMRATTGKFLDTASTGDVAGAYKQVRELVGVEQAAYDQTAEKASKYFAQVFERVGKPLSWAHVRSERIDDHLYRLTYLQKYQSAALYWEFTFYRPDDKGWALVNIGYGTDLSGLYEEVE